VIHIRGVHPVQAPERVHLIDAVLSARFQDIDWGSITQPDPAQPRANWQVAYDEQPLAPLPDGQGRAAFFFHYLDASRPLDSAYGPLTLPVPTPLPSDLKHIQYEEPG